MAVWTDEMKKAAGERMKARWAAVHAGKAPHPKMKRKETEKSASKTATNGRRPASKTSAVKNGAHPRTAKNAAKRASTWIDKISQIDERRTALDIERQGYVRELNQLVSQI